MAEAGAAIPKEFAVRIQRIIDRLDVFHRQVRTVEKRIEAIEQMAERVQLPRVRFAARDAFAKISASGSKLVACHLTLAHILTPPRDNGQPGEDAHG